jgi:hypothetical protein
VVAALQVDDAGRLIREYIRDDSGRTADHAYTYTAAGALSKVTLPSTSSIWFNHDSAGNNSDKDRITSVSRNTATGTLVKNATYYPFGPLRQYEHWNTIGGVGLRTKITRNLAYRVSDVRVENQTGTTTYQSVTITEDSKGRVTGRDHDLSANGIGVQDSYFIYDGLDRVLCETTNFVSSCPSAGSNIKNSHPLAPPFTATGDWKRLVRPLPGGGSPIQNDFNPGTGGPGLYGSSHRIVKVNQATYGDTNYAFDEYGRRSTETNTANPGNGDRTFTYNSRGLLTNVHGAFFSGGSWHGYDLASAYDAQGRRVYKSYYDNTTGNLATWFFYYDANDRLTEIKHTPSDTLPTNYSIYQFVWLNDRFVGYYMTSYPGATLTRRYVGTDETGRPIDMWSYPGSGNAARVWAINPNAFGGETPLVGTSVFQPFGRSAAFIDKESAVLIASGSAIQRPPLEVLDRWIVDPLSAAILQPPSSAADAAKIKVDGETIYDCRDWLINGFPDGEICTAVGYFWDEGEGYGGGSSSGGVPVPTGPGGGGSSGGPAPDDGNPDSTGNGTQTPDSVDPETLHHILGVFDFMLGMCRACSSRCTRDSFIPAGCRLNLSPLQWKCWDAHVDRRLLQLCVHDCLDTVCGDL